MAILAIGVQLVLTVPVADGPVRFGVPLPAAELVDGLCLRGPGRLQWRRLPVGGAASDPVWVEVGITGVRGRALLQRGGAGPTPGGEGPAFVRTRRERRVTAGREVVLRWAWADGSVDERERLEFHAPTALDGEEFAPGEARTRWRPVGAASAPPPLRAAVVCGLGRRSFEAAGVLPPGGRLGQAVRRRLLQAQRRLVELPGARGAGDFARGDGTITNGEFDTAFALLRLSLGTGDREAFARGLRAAQHLHDRDLDLRSGLPFPHGPDHRTGVPVAGHTWLHGLLLAGLLTADDDLIQAAQSIGRALAARPPIGRGRNERARDHAWPLLELEALLAVDPDPVVAAAADRLARGIDGRFDGPNRTFRFGEGEAARGYLERAWITGGLVVPALRQHLRRRPDDAIGAHVRIVERALLERIDTARGGLPTHWRCAEGRVFAEHRSKHDVRGLFLLEAVPPRDLRRLLRREELRDLVAELPALDDPDLPTSFSLLARCSWVYR